jgi:hypothetical protein
VIQAPVARLRAEAAAHRERAEGIASTMEKFLWSEVRRPLRPFWRPFSLRFTHVTSVIIKKY